MNETKSAVGLVGLGNIGLPMAVRLMSRFDVAAYDIADAARLAGTASGLQVAESIGEIAEQCRDVIVMVPDDAAVRRVVLGEADSAGLIERMSAGSLVVISATTSPNTCCELGAEAAHAGIGLVDAPVSGGAIGAQCGNLVAMVGGDRDGFLRCEELLKPLSRLVVHVGALGAGQLMKLLNSYIAFATFNATREALDLAELLGIDQELLCTVAQYGTADCWAVRHWPQHLAASRGRRPYARKDLGLLQSVLDEHARKSDLIPVLIEMSDRLYERADETSS